MKKAFAISVGGAIVVLLAAFVMIGSIGSITTYVLLMIGYFVFAFAFCALNTVLSAPGKKWHAGVCLFLMYVFATTIGIGTSLMSGESLAGLPPELVNLRALGWAEVCGVVMAGVHLILLEIET